MDPANAIELVTSALWLVVIVSGLPVLAAMGTGFVVSLFQAATSVSEPTLPVTPKIAAVYLTLLATGAWALQHLTGFATLLLQALAEVRV